jgi:glycosyltransferase involved in cell wall biosynthesis
MKMAMLVHSYYPADVRVRRECDALSDRGDLVDLICLQKAGEAPTETLGNVTVYRLPVQHHRGQGPLGYIKEYLNFFIRAFVKLSRLYVKEKYPIVQVHNMPDFLVFATLVPKLFGARILLDMHDITPELFVSLYGISEKSRTFKLLCLAERLSLSYADAVLTVNKNIRDLFLTRNPIARKIEVVMNAPDPRYFTPTGSGASDSTGAFRLFHHGQILRRYSFDVALEGFKIAKQHIPELELDIYGDGEEKYIAELKTFIQQNHLENCVRLHDRVPVEQIPGLISRAHIGLVPCKKDLFVDTVMLPVRLLEYVAMNIPSIVSRVGTVETYFTNDEVAYYTHDNPQQLSEQIIALYNNPQKRQDMVIRAQKAFAPHTWEKQKETYYRVIEGLMAPAFHKRNLDGTRRKKPAPFVPEAQCMEPSQGQIKNFQKGTAP